ncbi:MAG: PorT family protein [Candidatus Aminicenantes bacterium]|nr:PorT family protein [Candidatus Aminicenantes bacterium]MBL7083296.1 PorT family protein [Candidatus Aminicenantes bacterium]
MKKFLFVLFSIVLVSGAYAQEFKLICGLNLSKYILLPDLNQEIIGIKFERNSNYKTGFSLGCGVEFALSKNIAFEIDWLYSQKGCKGEIKPVYPGSYVIPTKYTLHLFSIPVILKIKFLPDSSPYILGGGEFSFVLTHRYTYIFNGGGDGLNITENTKYLDYGLVFGGGFEIRSKAASLFIEVRYHLGLQNISKDYFKFESIKTRAAVLILGFKI